MTGITQAELFGANCLDRIERDPRTGVGLAADRPKFDTHVLLAPSDEKVCKAMEAELDRLYADVVDAQKHDAPIGASPLPWHWQEGGGGVIDVFDARGAIVFRNLNFDGTDTARDWLNAELMVACVNKFASLITADELTRLRKKQVYGNENFNEEDVTK